MNIAAQIKDLRLSKGITQRELAEQTGISLRSIINYENGRREPNSKAMVALERYFGVSGEYLRGEVDRDMFMENSAVIQNELDQVITQMQRFNAAYSISDQEGQIVAATVLSQTLELIIQNLLHCNRPTTISSQEIMGPFTAIFQLNAAGRAELNKRAEELQQLTQYKK